MPVGLAIAEMRAGVPVPACVPVHMHMALSAVDISVDPTVRAVKNGGAAQSTSHRIPLLMHTFGVVR